MQYYIPQPVYLQAVEPAFGLDLQNLLIADTQDFQSLDLQNLRYFGVSASDVDKTHAQLCNERGLSFEEFTVITEDGYHLQVHHIWHRNKNGPPVFMQHGLFSSADTWMLNKDKSPAFIAAKAGYDVWLGNNRGTKHSRKHNTLRADKGDAKYFDYSFYELGQYDAPAQIDFVRKMTGRDKISYIGHSQGTSQMFSALAENHGNLNEKINLFVSLCPITNLKHASNIIGQLTQLTLDIFYNALDLIGLHELMGPSWNEAKNGVCRVFPCDMIMSAFITFKPSAYNDGDAAYLQNQRSTSAGSRKQLIHYAQTSTHNRFHKYDHNWAMNWRLYGSPKAPDLDLSKIRVPMAMFVGKQDDLGTPEMGRWTVSKLSVQPFYKELDNWDHSTYAIGKDMSYFDDVLGLLRTYN